MNSTLISIALNTFQRACVTSDFPCKRFRYEPWYTTRLDVGQWRQQWPRPERRSRTERVGVHAGEERPERRPHRHEQQQHIADTRLPREPGWTTADARTSATPDTHATAVSARRRTPDTGGATTVRASGVRAVGHGPVRGHSRVEKTVARPTAGTCGRHACRTNDTAPDATAGHRGGATTAGTSVGPVPAARRRPVGRTVRLQAAPVADQHGGRQARAAIRRGPAPATAAAGKGRPESGAAVAFDRARPLQANAVQFVVPQVQRARFDHTGRLP